MGKGAGDLLAFGRAEAREPRARLTSVRAAWQSPPLRSDSRAARPAVAPTPPFTECPAVGADTSCGLLLDVTDAGVIVLEDPSQGPYDGSDDTLVGVLNQSSTAIEDLTLESTAPIFAFDGDGICSGLYGSIPGCPFGPTGYEGPGTAFVDIAPNFTSGGVTFSGGVPPGATAYFSLEAPLSASSIISPSYVALGDSVAAGEGIGYGWYWNATAKKWEGGSSNGIWDETFEPEQCHQTTEGYPHLVADELGASLLDLACTGASAFDGVLGERVNSGGIFGLGSWTAPAQLGSSIGLSGSAPPNPEYDAARPQLVSLTLGADDVNFAEIVGECYEEGCSTDQSRLDGVLAEQEAHLALVLEEIHRRGLADGLTPLTAVTEYYNPFPAYDPNCVDLIFGPLGIFGISNDEMRFLIKGLERLNHNIATVAHRYHLLVLNTNKLLEKHRFCSANGPWVYGPSIDVDDFPHFASAAPFHPTPEGQQVIGEALARLASSRVPVSPGSNVYVGLPYGLLNFADVTSPGEATIIPAADLPGSSPPADTFAMAAAYDIATSAEYSGEITVSLPSTTALSMYHYTEGAWQEQPSSFNGAYVTGTVTSLSPFALGTPVSPVHARLAAPVGGGEAPAAVSLDASASSVNDGSGIASYQWEFGDEATGIGPAPTHVYTNAGTYTVNVTVTADDGAVDSASQEVTITHAPPHAVLAGPASGNVGQTLRFDSSGSSASGGPIIASLWEFGDGSEPVAGTTAAHAYATPGTYQLTLKVRDEEGATDTVTLPVAITAGAVAGGNGGGAGGVHTIRTSGVARRARISIGRTLRRNRHGYPVVALHCGAGVISCSGIAELRMRRGKKLVVVGRAHFYIGARKSVGIVVKLTGKLARIARTGALELNVLVVEGGGSAVTANARLAGVSRGHGRQRR